MPPDLHLSDDKKSKIAGEKYVKFGSLLYKDKQNEQKFTLKLNASNSFNANSFVVDPNENCVRIKHIEVWDKAFTIYQYCYLKSHPEQAQGLLMYGRMIKDMAWRGFCWLQYDEQFRMLRETDPKAYPWGSIEPTLWSTWAIPRVGGQFNLRGQFNGRGQGRGYRGYMHNQGQNSGYANYQDSYASDGFGRGCGFGRFRNNSFGNRGHRFNSRPAGNFGFNANSRADKLCFRFNAGRSCRQPCIYKHSCLKCGADGHGELNCRN